MRSLLIALFTIISVQNTYSQSDQTLLGNVRDGYGIWLYKNLGIYEGVWKDNEKSGRGQIIYPDGQRYAGNYRNDVKFGPGVLLWPSGSRYTGYWNDQNRHGWGEMAASDGTIKTGFWKDDKFISDVRPSYKITPDGKGSFKTVQEAINAAIPGTEIVIAEGNYEEYLSISNKLNLIIRGEGEVWFKVPTGDIFTIGNSQDITITNIKGIHTVRETESGCSTSNVMNIFGSSEIRIIQCVLDGCGQIGLSADNVISLLIANNIVQNCIFGGIELYQCRDVLIENNLVVNQKMDAADSPRGVALNVTKSSNFEIRNNTIANNFNFLPFYIGGEFTGGRIHHNIIAFNKQPDAEAKIIESDNMNRNTVFFDHNLVYENYASTRLLTASDSLVKITHTVTADPLFVNIDQRNYTLKNESPALIKNMRAVITPIPTNYSLSLQDPRFTANSPLKNGAVQLSGHDTTVYAGWPYSDKDGWVFINGRLMNYVNGSWEGKILKNEIGVAVLTAVLRDGRVGQSMAAVDLKEPPVRFPQGDQIPVLAEKANALIDSGLFKQALPYYVLINRIDPFNADGYLLRAWCYARLNDTARAESFADLGIKAAYVPEAHFVKGYVHLLLGDLEKAKNAFGEGLRWMQNTGSLDVLKDNLKKEFLNRNLRVKETKEILSWVDPYYLKNGKAFTDRMVSLSEKLKNETSMEAFFKGYYQTFKSETMLPDEFWNNFWVGSATYFVYSNQDFTSGLQCLANAEERYPKDDVAAASAKVRIARVYSDIYDALGQYDKQSRYLQNALPFCDKLPTLYAKIGILNSLASAEAFQKKQTAFDYIKQARELAEKTGNPYHMADAYVRSCMLLMNNSNTQDAEAAKYAEKALAIARENKLTYSLNGALSNLAINYFRRGEYAKGLKFYDEAIDSAKSGGNLRDAELYLNNAGSMVYMMKDYGKAAKYFSEAVTITEKLRRNMSGDERKLYFANVVSAYQFLSMSYARLGKGKELFETLESLKARSLAEQLTGSDSVKTISLQEAQALLGPDEAMISYMLSYSALEIIISVVTREQTVAIHTTRTNLFDGIKTRYGSELKIITENKRGFKPKQNPAEAGQLPEIYSPTGFIFDEMVELYRKTLQSGQNEALQSELGGLFYSALIDPAGIYLKNKTKLLIVPENTLGYLPFETLKDPTGSYLAEKFSIRYTQSMSVYGISSGRSYAGNRSTILAMGNPVYDSDAGVGSERAFKNKTTASEPISQFNDFMQLESDIEKRLSEKQSLRPAYLRMGIDTWQPLPGTAQELSDIKNIAGDAVILSQHDANEKKIKALSNSGELTKYRILHFASHGVVLPALPSLSAVVLSQYTDPRDGDDGYLTMKEITGLKCNADLITLSACETGLGKLYGGEGVVGLTQAFQQAGANGLSVSLWSVADESTAKFMSGFYDLCLKQNKTYADAMTEMKRRFIRGEFGETYKKPFYWGPFVYYGK